MDKPIALVTGAANGIGKAISEHLKEDGFFVVLVDIDKENGINLVEKLGNKNSAFFNCNIVDEKELEDFFKNILSRYGKIDAVVNNAGIIRDNMIWNMPVSDFDSVINLNLRAVWMICKEAAKVMKERKSGKIVNITSRAWLGNRGQSNYSSSKAGVIGLTRVLALELGKFNVSVNAVAPGLIDTPLTQKLSSEVIKKLIDAQPTKAMGKPEDVAHAVSFLLSPKTNFITGQTLYVDGGKHIGAGI